MIGRHDIDFDVELSGFSTGEIDLLLDGKPALAATDPVDDLTGLASQGPAVSQLGDSWQLGRHPPGRDRRLSGCRRDRLFFIEVTSESMDIGSQVLCTQIERDYQLLFPGVYQFRAFLSQPSLTQH